jgi:HK97 family phage prohead protease
MSDFKRSEYIVRKIETRVDDKQENGKKLVLRGYPILFNTETKIYDFWYGEVEETILPTALDKTDLTNVFLLSGHNPDNLLGRTGINMRVEVDETGLFFECELPNTQLARDIYNLVEMGILDGMSFGFRCSDEVNPETKKRTITQIDELYEITITPFPAYKEASVVAQENAEKKSKSEEINNKLKELEDM